MDLVNRSPSMAFTKDQTERLSSSFAFIKPRLGLVADLFEQALLESAPKLSSHFPLDRVTFELNMLLICGHIADLDLLGDRFAEMGEDLNTIAISADDFPAAREAMLRAFASVSGYTWTQRLHDDWADVFNTAAAFAFNSTKSVQRAA